MKIIALTAIWKRPEVFRLFARGISKLGIEVVIVGSEGEVSKKQAEIFGFHYLEYPNQPLSEKHNQGMLKCRELDADFVLCLGSDDIMHPDLFKEYEQSAQQGIDFTAVLDFYFYHLPSKRSIYWGGYRENWRKGHSCGAGRMLSAKLLDKWNWKPWEVKHSHILDNSIEDKLKATPHTSNIFSIKEKGLYAMDIKSEVNMTPFDAWDNSYGIDSKILEEKFSYIW